MARRVAVIKSDFPTLDEVAKTYNISSSRRKKLDAFVVDYLSNRASAESKAGGETTNKRLRKTASPRAALKKSKK